MKVPYQNHTSPHRSKWGGRSSGITYLVRVFLVVLIANFSSTMALAVEPDSSQLWQDIEQPQNFSNSKTARLIIPDNYRLLAADIGDLDNLLSQAPLEFSAAAKNIEIVLALPLPDGTFSRFRIVESPIMAPALAAKFPEIKSYRGFGIDDLNATARIDRTPAGFHAIIFSVRGTVYIDPYQRGDVINYMSYYKRNLGNHWGKTFKESLPIDNKLSNPLLRTSEKSGDILHTYRLAVAATGEYTQFHGGTVAGALSAIVTTINRVTGIYERELSVKLVLVANNDKIIYTDPQTDPYTNTNKDLDANQSNLDKVIGNANYDIGHLVGTGGGGVAYLGVVCNNAYKGRGLTGFFKPVGDPFDVLVAHEMGHQFGGHHTFNAIDANNCSSDNRNANTAYEPGSGSTIMAYAGTCNSQDLQSHRDDYFHGANFDEIITHVNSVKCGTTKQTGNNAPVVDAGNNYTIPAKTPFTLTGSATDKDKDTLHYNWEQFDLGAGATGTLPNADIGEGPIFRSYPPVSSSSRTFPNPTKPELAKIGESLPTTNRTMHFRLTARDGKGGVSYDSMEIKVIKAAGPFQVTAPNTAVTWQVGQSKTVTWDVANTNGGEVNCATVKILLSTDSGKTFPVTLKTNTTNDGSESITVPNNPSKNARVKVACATNVFFDQSDTNFSIIANTSPPAAATLVSPKETITDHTPTYTWKAVSDSSWYYLWVNKGTAKKLAKWYKSSDLCSSDTCKITPSVVLANGDYKWWIQTWNSKGHGPWSNGMSFSLTGAGGPPTAATLVSPKETITDHTPTYIWNAVPNSSWYYLWVKDDTKPVFLKWYKASEAGCSDGTGECKITPAKSLINGKHTWWIQTWNSYGYGKWSSGMDFTLTGAGGPPIAATLISPSGAITDRTPSYKWKAVSNSTWYYLWINEGTKKKFAKWYKASEAGCENGSSDCVITPSTNLADGKHSWWIQTWNGNGYGAWSSRMDFNLNAGKNEKSTANFTSTLNLTSPIKLGEELEVNLLIYPDSEHIGKSADMILVLEYWPTNSIKDRMSFYRDTDGNWQIWTATDDKLPPATYTYEKLPAKIEETISLGTLELRGEYRWYAAYVLTDGTVVSSSEPLVFVVE